MTRTFLAPGAIALLAVLGAVRCASGVRTSAPDTATAPPGEAGDEAGEDDADRPPLPPPAQAPVTAAEEDAEKDVQRRERRAREAYQAGLEAVEAGRLDHARDHFDDALEVLFEPGPGAADPRLEELLAQVADAMQALERAEPREAAERAEADRLAEIEPEITPQRAAEEAEVVAEASEEVTYDLPMVINEPVLAWVDIYSGRMREPFARGMERSGWYLPMIKRIFAEEGLPTDLAYLAHVESSYKPTAYSRAHAKGVFQFIASTGRRYGLARNWWMDLRSDPELSARAAARYLGDLHAEFGDWYLALAAYNAGENRVRRGIARTGRRDFWALSRAGVLRRETRNYVPAILAAILISKNPDAYGFGDVVPFPPVEYDTVTVDTPTDLRVIASCGGTDVQELKRLNPALYRLQTPPGVGAFPVHVPKGSAERFAEGFAKVPVSERILFAHHVVRRGETLSTIARRYGATVPALQTANNMGRRTMIREGAVLRVPTSSGSLAAAAASPDGEAQVAGEAFAYRVRRGDTLATIARRFGTTVASLQRANDLGRSTRIVAGATLRVPGTSAGPSSPESFPATVVVRRGETLSTIAGRSGTSVAALQAANGLGRSTRIYAGQTLRLPGSEALPAPSPQVHTVSLGETLARIAKRYGTTIQRLCTWNGMRASDTLYPGRRLVVAQ